MSISSNSEPAISNLDGLQLCKPFPKWYVHEVRISKYLEIGALQDCRSFCPCFEKSSFNVS